jgi:hypothetical protein
MSIKKRNKLVPALVLICLLALMGSMKLAALSAPVKKRIIISSKKPIITEQYAISKIKQHDKNVRRLISCNKKNTIVEVVNKYSKNYFMFLVNYGIGQDEYTSEKLYLVNKKTGSIYTLMVNGTPILVADSP